MRPSVSLPGFLMAFALAFPACQTNQKKSAPIVPAAMSAAELVRIEQAISAAPKSLAVFSRNATSSPLDPTRSGVIVDLDRQRAYVYSEGQLIAATRIASGKRSYRTPTGDFRIGQKNPNHASNLYGKLVHTETGEVQPGEVDTRTAEIPEGMVFQGAPMRHFMRFNTLDGKSTPIGFHQGHVPNRPASHGCIRMPANSARELFKMLPKGMPVFVYGDIHGQPARALPVLEDPPPKVLKKEKRKISQTRKKQT